MHRPQIWCASLQVVTEGSNIGALIIRIGRLEAHYTITITRNPQNSIGTYRGPYSTSAKEQLEALLVALLDLAGGILLVSVLSGVGC